MVTKSCINKNWSLGMVLATTAVMTVAVRGAEWPAWNGPNQDLYAPATGLRLVSGPEVVKEVWVSDEKIPGARAADARAVEQTSVSGGYASPVLADGRVFLYYYVPNGEVRDKRFVADTKFQFGNGVTPAKWAIETDEWIHCFDARTGKTLWKTRYEKAGLNWGIGFNKGGPAVSSTVADGRVFAVSTLGEVLCVEAKGGKKLWQAPIKERYELLTKLREECLKRQEAPQFNRSFNGTPVAHGDVLLVPWFFIRVQHPYKIYTHDKGLAAFDAATGKQLWSKECHAGSVPLRWTRGPRRLVIVGNGYGTECLDANTGETLWKSEVMFRPTTVQGDVMIAIKGKEKEACLAGYRLTSTGAERLWEQPGFMTYAMPVVMGERLVAASGDRLLMLDLTSGRMLAEIESGKWDGAFFGCGDLLFLQSDFVHGNAQCTVWRVKTDGFDNLGKWPLGIETSYTTPLHPAMGDGYVYIRTPERLKCLDITTGR